MEGTGFHSATQRATTGIGSPGYGTPSTRATAPGVSRDTTAGYFPQTPKLAWQAKQLLACAFRTAPSDQRSSVSSSTKVRSQAAHSDQSISPASMSESSARFTKGSSS